MAENIPEAFLKKNAWGISSKTLSNEFLNELLKKSLKNAGEIHKNNSKGVYLHI